jgi:hypothetical protein
VTAAFDLAAPTAPMDTVPSIPGSSRARRRLRRGGFFTTALVFGAMLACSPVPWPFFPWPFCDFGSNILLRAAERANEPVKLARDDLQRVIAAASVARVYSFPREGELGPERSVATVKPEAGALVSGEALQRLRSAMLSSQSYQGDAGLQNSCPFDPRIGFRFSEGAKEAWWLVSKSCRNAILVGRTDDWRAKGVVTLNLTAAALDGFVQWAGRP